MMSWKYMAAGAYMLRERLQQEPNRARPGALFGKKKLWSYIPARKMLERILGGRRVPRISELSLFDLIAAAAWVLAAYALRHRIPYGVNHGDEAFYSSIPYEFAIGNRPYIDEVAPHQNAGVLLVPFYWLYLKISGASDGIVLFNRYLYFVYAAVASWLAYRFVARIERRSTGCWAAALVLTWAYFNMFALSYNTEGALGFVCGILCAATALLEVRPARQLFVASLFFMSAVYSYPGLILAIVPYALVVLLWLYRNLAAERRRNALVGLGAGATLAVLIVVPLAIWIGRDNFRRLMAFQNSLGYLTESSLRKLDFYHSPYWSWRWTLLLFIAGFAAVPVLYSRLRRWPWLAAAASLPVLWLLDQKGMNTPGLNSGITLWMTIWALTPVCLMLNRGWRCGSLLLKLVWLPSCLSMIATTYTSSNGFLATSLGALGALVSGGTSLSAYLDTLARRNPAQRWSYALGLMAFMSACLYMQIESMYGGVYDVDSVMSDLTTRVHSGPFRGTLTNHEEAVFTEAVDRDLKQAAAGQKTLIVFDTYATGYLSTRLRPRAWTTWIDWFVDQKYIANVMTETFPSREQLPDLVLEVKMCDIARGFWKPYADQYRVVVNNTELGYRILQHEPLAAEPAH
jgi:hypothetical protein